MNRVSSIFYKYTSYVPVHLIYNNGQPTVKQCTHLTTSQLVEKHKDSSDGDESTGTERERPAHTDGRVGERVVANHGRRVVDEQE